MVKGVLNQDWVQSGAVSHWPYDLGQGQLRSEAKASVGVLNGTVHVAQDECPW